MAAAATARIVSSPFGEKTRPRSGFKRLLVSSSDKYEDTSTTPTEDPLRILAPGQKKLTNIESQRILGVVDEAIKRLDYARVIPYLASNITRFSVTLGAQLVKLLEEYNAIVRDYNHLYETLQLEELPVLESFSNEEQLFESAMSTMSSSSSLDSSFSSRGHPVQLDPLHERDSEPSVSKLQRVRFRLRMNVKCTLRELAVNAIPSSILPTEKPKSSAILHDSVR